MSPVMLTLVAAVEAYDFALETCESETREEKDMVVVEEGGVVNGGVVFATRRTRGLEG
jgi:hypothetical protein